jgi:TIGR03009 family protein
MRYFGLSVACLLVIGQAALTQQPAKNNPAANPTTERPAQQPPAAAPVNPAGNRLEALLSGWERALTPVQTISAQITRTSVNKTFQVAEVYEGTAKYMKPNRALLHMKKKGKEHIYEKYVATGTFLYEYVPAEKLIRVHEMPTPKPGQVADDNFMSFLFGMRADEAKRRYDMKLVKGPPEDPHYYYIEILPKFPQDKADFQKARLVLMAQTFLPRELWFEEANGNEVKWDIPKIETGVPMKVEEFTQPNEPGWKIEKMPKNNPQPRVVRPNQP